jgi:hypothetical protein
MLQNSLAAVPPIRPSVNDNDHNCADHNHQTGQKESASSDLAVEFPLFPFVEEIVFTVPYLLFVHPFQTAICEQNHAPGICEQQPEQKDY